jgi:fatty acid/phospholipid biosynthesis enzyme
VKPSHLLQFALMGSVAAEIFLSMPRPRVGLLSNGEEEGKGRELERAAYALLADSDLDFVGNVEGATSEPTGPTSSSPTDSPATSSSRRWRARPGW